MVQFLSNFGMFKTYIIIFCKWVKVLVTKQTNKQAVTTLPCTNLLCKPMMLNVSVLVVSNVYLCTLYSAAIFEKIITFSCHLSASKNVNLNALLFFK